ncbi:MAG TPA: iron chelate uptake ABC transporter family permease subunit, partial [Gaiellaceae bacterium]
MTVAAEHASEVRARGLSPLWACSAVAFLLVSLVVGVLAGPVDLGVGAVLESAAARLHVPGFSSSLSPTEEAILWEIRVPRVVLAALVGAMLALAGATYQGVFRNPLADPYLLGVAA